MDCAPKLDTQLIKVQFFVAKPKYSLETRLAAVNHYLAGHDGARRIAERFGVEETSLRKRDKFSPRPCHIYAPSIGGNFPVII